MYLDQQATIAMCVTTRHGSSASLVDLSRQWQYCACKYLPGDSISKPLCACGQAYGQQSRLQKYCKFFRRQHMLDKFDSTIQQLDEHNEMAWKLQDNDMVLRRRGMRASFTKGPSVYSPSLSADSTGPNDSTVLGNGGGAGNSLLPD